MKNLITTLLFAACFLGTIAAQNKSSLLWKISGNGLTEPSYIYGTIHIICPQDYHMRDAIKTAFAQTKQVYLEIDFDNPKMMQKMMASSMLTNGKTARDYLSEEEYQILDANFKNTLGMGMNQLQTLKPLILLSMSYISLIACQPQSFEATFVNMAKTQNKEVLGLETVDFQMGIFDKIPLDMQYKMIADIVKQKDKALLEFKELVSIYKQENIEGLLDLMNTSEWNFDDFEDILINNRNKTWTDKFTEIANENSTFFAVGAGHLAGEKGWLQLLKNKGYIVEAIK
jgi:uncharacterized protein YbaP (TraB family)